MTTVTRYARTARDQHRERMLQTVYDFIAAFIDEHNGLSPTLREIADGCYLSRTAIMRYIDLLEARGYILRDFNIPRSIRLTRPDDRL